MIKTEMVPDGVVEALIATLHGKPGLPYREAIAAALNAWPGMLHDTEHEKRTSYLILPLAPPPAGETNE